MRQAVAIIVVGAMLGGFGWYQIDRTTTITHIAGWLAGNTAIFAMLAWLLLRNPVQSIAIDDAGLTIERACGTSKFLWADIEAARFWDYPLATVGGQPIRYFLLRAGGKTLELLPDFIDEATCESFESAILRELELRGIPRASECLPTFEHNLSHMGAWVFLASIFGMLAAHAMGFHTLGTVFGLGFLLTGSTMAWMTRRERLSRVVLSGTLLLIVAGSGILWACHINVREILQRWEQIEKGSPPRLSGATSVVSAEVALTARAALDVPAKENN